MITINLSQSQYRVVSSGSPSTVECSSAVPNAVPVSSTARASRMSQFQATVPPAKPTAPTTKTTNHHHIYGLVNLALLAVSIYLLWANF